MDPEDLARVVGQGKRLFGKAKKAVREVATDAAHQVLGKNEPPQAPPTFNAGELGYKVGAKVGELISEMYGDKIPRAEQYGAATQKAVQEGTTAVRGGLEKIASDIKVATQSITERLASDKDRKITIGKVEYEISDRCVTRGEVARVAGYMIISSREIPSGLRGRQELITYIAQHGVYSTVDLKKRASELSPLAKTALTYLK